MGICKNGANIKCAYSEIGGTEIKLNITTEKKKDKKERIVTAIDRLHGQVAILKEQ